MRDDIIEGREIKINRGRKIDAMKADIRDSRLGRQVPRIVDVRRHRVDGVKGSSRMGCRKDVGGDPLATAEVAPGKSGLPLGRRRPGHQGHMIEPSRSQRRLEVAQIWDVSRIAVEIEGHRTGNKCYI